MFSAILLSIILLIGVSICIFRLETSNKSFRWLSFFIFVSGVGWFNVLFNEHIIPYLTSVSDNPSLKGILWFSLSIFSAFTHYCGPFFYLMFSIKYSEAFSEKMAKSITVMFVISIIIMNIVFPIYNFKYYHINSNIFWVISSIWALAIAIISIYALIYSYIREIPGNKKIEKEIVCISLVPIGIYVLIANYFLFIFGITDAWRINIWYISLIVPFFFYRFIRLGLTKLNTLHYNTSVYAVNTSVDMFFHEIKKDVNNIHISLTNYIENNDVDPGSVLEFTDIYNSVERLNGFLKISHSFVYGININLKENEICPLINEAIESVLVICRDKNINIKFDKFNTKVICDTDYIVSVFRNLLLNSIESIEKASNKGVIDIYFKISKKYIAIIIKDNGIGIPKDYFKSIFHPYFTTKKKSKTNHGLGLTYCREVIEKHGGSITLENNKLAGVKATVYLKKI